MAKRVRRVSDYFTLGKAQAELDFVDVPIVGDILLFVDPYALSLSGDPWFVDCNNLVVDFFEQTVKAIAAGNYARAMRLLANLHEPDETHLGWASPGSGGRGIGRLQAGALFKKLEASKAVKTGQLADLSDAELVIEGIGPDKISDITINVIRGKLITYTQAQCQLLGIPMQSVAAGPTWDPSAKNWVNAYDQLPVVKAGPLLLVPKVIVRFGLLANHQNYYRHFVLDFLQKEHLSSNSSLVEVLKNGKRVVYKTELEKHYPPTKDFLFEFSEQHPDVLEKYYESIAKTDRTPTSEDIEGRRKDHRDIDIAALCKGLSNIPSGKQAANAFHNYAIGIVSAIFDTLLHSPKKEQPSNEGRKKIDITYSRTDHAGFFSDLQHIHEIKCPYVFFECKNYTEDPANPEFDQLIGRFGPKRGMVGFLVCRKIQNRALVTARCRDAALQDQGYIIVLDDKDLCELLTLRAACAYGAINAFLDERFKLLVV